MKKAIIVGYKGQDGFYLSEILKEKNYQILGLGRENTLLNNKEILFVDIHNARSVEECIEQFQPDEIYFLAAVHQSSADVGFAERDLFVKSIETNQICVVYFLEAIKKYSPKTRFFYAASSHLFGSPTTYPQDENTPFNPNCIYGITKVAGVQTCRYYRESYHLFTSCAFFYNHESERRASKFVSKKIVETAVKIKMGLASELILGDLNAQIDWGYAPDYMQAVWMMMQADKPDDYIISSGKSHTIQDFVEICFLKLGLNWREYVTENPQLITKKPKKNLLGNPKKAEERLGWKAKTSLEVMIEMMITHENRKYNV